MKVITIGRAPDNDVAFDDPMLSRNHLQIVQEDDGRFFVVDLGSTNGTYKNGQLVFGLTELKDGDFVRAGNVMIPWQDYFAEDFVSLPNNPEHPFPQINVQKTIQEQMIKTDFHPVLLVWLWASISIYALYAIVSFVRAFSNMGIFDIGMVLVGGLAVIGLLYVKEQKMLGFYLYAGAHLLLFIIGCGFFPGRFFAAGLLGVGSLAAMLAIQNDGKSGWKLLVNNNKLKRQ